MKRALSFGLMLAFLAAAALAAPVQLKWDSLWAGKDTNAGEFQVFATSTGLTIVVWAKDSWLISEARVAVHLNSADIPMNKKGNPIIGHFAWSETSCPQTAPYVFNIPYSSISSGSLAGATVYVAVHAVLVQGFYLADTPPCNFYCCIDETAWGGPCGSWWDPSMPLPPEYFMFPGRSWGYYFSVVIPNPYPAP